MVDHSEIPGTSHLVELSKERLMELNAGDKDKDVILIPTPTSDPNDPLNWTRTRKYIHMFALIVYIFGIGIPTTSIYSILTELSDKTGISLGTLNDGTGYMFLFLGLANLFFLPMAMQIGKRPIYIFSVTSVCLLTLWEAYCSSGGEWIGSKILQGFFAAPIEAMCEITVSDVFFEHERGTWMSVYALALFASNYMAPMVAGFISDGQGWKWVIYWSCIWNGIAAILVFFLLEETNYSRPVPIDGETDQLEIVLSNVKSGTVQEVLSQQLSHQPSEKQVFISEVEVLKGTLKLDETIPVKTFWQKLRLFEVRNWEWFKHYATGPFLMLQFPIVLYSGFLYGSTLFWYSVMNGTMSSVFTAHPYNFSSAMTGLVYLAPLIFAVIFNFYAGYVSDWLKIKMAERRGGISYAEDRLWILLLYMIVGPCALFLYGIGAYYEVHWFGLVIGAGITGGCVVVGAASACSYCIDTYREMSCEAMVVVVIIRNTMNFAMDYGITPWITNTGLKNTFIAAGFINLFCIGTFLIMELTGPYWRNKTKEKYWKIIEKRRAAGICH
ncbi:unnamed protein product [Kuraishia capsulata CBS 1993]|uniref:Major facilitator superfamily (MFS) profile domain-containing protein n=1 Tax=Kuraishia capsulata CBS 1993 TaxID=1382522 RepID=W6MTS5_9ASCO|nr:uncharacterized protein KUCA_T00001182001 [Kuraishia capsulata CBS 1993]CDK25215.1 unnamed protein product [Kuraishia capsulata CBS 1993]